MIVLIILIMVVIGLAGWRLMWRKTSVLLVCLALALFVGVGCGPVAAWLLADLQTPYAASTGAVTPHSSGAAIVLLGNGTERIPGTPGVEPGPLAYGRLVKTLELYQTCKRVYAHCYVVVSGGDPEQHGATEAAVYGARLRQLGVDSADLFLDERSLNTWQNAQYSAPILRAHAVDQVLLVTSGIHLRRSLLYFGHFGVHAQPVRADWVSALPSTVPVSYNFLVTDLVLHEYVGIVRYSIYERMGWNAPAQEYKGSP